MLPAYGVTIGVFDHSGDHQGKWLHELVYLRAGGTLYQCAVDVNEPTGIFQYKTLGSLDRSLFQAIAALPDGYHSLSRDSASGAIDYIRSPLIQQSEGGAWNDVTGDEAGNALASLVTSSSRVYVFGAPYSVPEPGMHDVHMNQGDPIASSFHSLDAIWQDGCVIVDGEDGKLAGYLGKFATQSLTTDSNGWPVGSATSIPATGNAAEAAR